MAENSLLQNKRFSTKPLSRFEPDAAFAAKRIALSKCLGDLVNFQRFGDCLSESYSDLEGSKWWATFVSEDVQGPLRDTPMEYYASSDEILLLAQHKEAIAQVLLSDRDLDPQNLVIIEKGSGSKTAILNKTFPLLNAISDAGGNVGFYATREHSLAYREEAKHLFADLQPVIPMIAQDTDFNKEDLPLGLAGDTGPRIIFEFGSSRSNIATSEKDAVPYEDLYATFAHDRKVCRDGGYVVMACDCNQDKVSLEGSFSHPSHAEFSKNIFRRGLKEGVITDDLRLSDIEYVPVWDKKRHLLKHVLKSKRTQNFGLYQLGKAYVPSTLHKDKEYIYSHSFRWPTHIVTEAAERSGFKTHAIFKDSKDRITIFIFKAI